MRENHRTNFGSPQKGSKDLSANRVESRAKLTALTSVPACVVVHIRQGTDCRSVQRTVELTGHIVLVNLDVPGLRRESGLVSPPIAPAGMPAPRVDGPHFRVGSPAEPDCRVVTGAWAWSWGVLTGLQMRTLHGQKTNSWKKGR